MVSEIKEQTGGEKEKMSEQEETEAFNALIMKETEKAILVEPLNFNISRNS
jgi:hypothetical protein